MEVLGGWGMFQVSHTLEMPFLDSVRRSGISDSEDSKKSTAPDELTAQAGLIGHTKGFQKPLLKEQSLNQYKASYYYHCSQLYCYCTGCSCSHYIL